MPLKPLRWWWRDGSRIVYLTLKSGAKTLELAPGKRTIEVGAVAHLQAKLALIHDAVRVGELDHCAAAPKTERTKPLTAATAAAQMPGYAKS